MSDRGTRINPPSHNGSVRSRYLQYQTFQVAICVRPKRPRREQGAYATCRYRGWAIPHNRRKIFPKGQQLYSALCIYINILTCFYVKFGHNQ